MSALPKRRRLTVAEYLAIENAAEFRSEFYDGEMFAMAGARPDHNEIKDNLIVEVSNRLRGGRCRTYSSDQRVKVEATGLYTYPDVLIVCGRREIDPDDPMTLTNPTVLFEVLSPTTAAYDRGTKLHQYQKITTARAVVLVSSDQVYVDVYSRDPDGRWFHAVFNDPAGDLVIPGLPAEVRIPLADVYRDVELPDQPPLRTPTTETPPSG